MKDSPCFNKQSQREIYLENFVNIRDKLSTEYFFIYHINDGYSITDLAKIKIKNQLFFQKINNNVKQLNLMIIDSLFPFILSDLTLDVLLNNINSFSNYVKNKESLIINNIQFNQSNMKHKFNYFINLLLLSNISSDEVFNGNIDSNKIFFLKNQLNQIQYFSIYEMNELQNLLFNKITLEIDFTKSLINDSAANICLKILYKS